MRQDVFKHTGRLLSQHLYNIDFSHTSVYLKWRQPFHGLWWRTVYTLVTTGIFNRYYVILMTVVAQWMLSYADIHYLDEFTKSYEK